MGLLDVVVSAFYAKRQAAIAEAAGRTAARASLREAHDPYVSALTNARDEHRDEIRSLARGAAGELSEIARIVGEYDYAPRSGCELGHQILNASRCVCLAFMGQLAWQTGPNIRFRVHGMRWVEHDLRDSTRTADLSAEFFYRQYRANPNACQELGLLSNREFCATVNDVRRRISSPKAGELLIRVHRHVEPLRRCHADVVASTTPTLKRLESLLRRNELEQFPLEYSPNLEREFKRWVTTVATLGELRIPAVADERVEGGANAASLLIYLCTILHMMCSFEGWGWTGRNER